MKKCGNCHETKPSDQFAWKNKVTGKRQSVCKICARIYCRRYYQKDPASFLRAKKVREKRYQARTRSFIVAFLAQHPCVDCGETNPVVLEFDHVGGQKQKDISTLISQRASHSRLVDEIAKCEVRCANWHRKRTSRVRGYWKGEATGGETMRPAETENPQSPW